MQGPSGYHLIINIDTLTHNIGFLYQNVMSKMTINIQNVHYTDVQMFILTSLLVFTDCLGTSESGRKNTLACPVVLFNTLQSPRQGHHSVYGMSQFLAEVGDLNMGW